MKNICFTGHRKLDSENSLQIKILLDSVICSLVKRGATDFYCGGALGWDTLCANMVLYLKKRKALDIRLHLVLPCSNEEQTKLWNDSDRQVFYSILEHADEVEYIGSEYTPDCMRKRNARLVEHADGCVCYYDCTTRRSGTAQTVRMAQEKGIEIINDFELADDTAVSGR